MEISKERKEELLETHLLNYEMPDEQELAKLTLEELEFLIRSAEVHHKMCIRDRIPPQHCGGTKGSYENL